MRFYILLVALGLVLQSASPHDPNLATIIVRQKKGVWVIEVSCSQAGLHQAISKIQPELANADINSDKYKQAVVDHARKTILLTANSFGQLVLGQGGIKLGNHQSDLKFELTGMPEILHEIRFEISFLSANQNHSNVVRIEHGSDVSKCILNASNNYSETIVFGP